MKRSMVCSIECSMQRARNNLTSTNRVTPRCTATPRFDPFFQRKKTSVTCDLHAPSRVPAKTETSRDKTKQKRPETKQKQKRPETKMQRECAMTQLGPSCVYTCVQTCVQTFVQTCVGLDLCVDMRGRFDPRYDPHMSTIL